MGSRLSPTPVSRIPDDPFFRAAGCAWVLRRRTRLVRYARRVNQTMAGQTIVVEARKTPMVYLCIGTPSGLSQHFDGIRLGSSLKRRVLTRTTSGVLAILPRHRGLWLAMDRGAYCAAGRHSQGLMWIDSPSLFQRPGRDGEGHFVDCIPWRVRLSLKSSKVPYSPRSKDLS